MAIILRVLAPRPEAISPDAARTILSLGFTTDDDARVQYLAEQASAGALTAEEREAYDGYVAANEVLMQMQSRARLALRRQPSAA